MTSLKTAAALTVPVLALSLLVGFSGNSADKVAFTPAEGAVVTKTFTTTTTMEMDDMTSLMNGQPAPIPEMEMVMEMTHAVTVTDEYTKMADSQVLQLVRSYDAVSSELEMDINAGGDAQSPSGSGSSPLEGTTVQFNWNAETEEYDVKFAEGEDGDADLLADLAQDMDVRGLLPTEELSKGDSYEIDLAGMVEILAPGGDLKIEMEMDEGGADAAVDPEMMTDFRQFFEELLEGDASGKYVGTREVDGVTVAVIELTIEIDASADMSELAAESMGDEVPEGVEFSIDRMDVTLSYEGAGELHWNMAKGVLHSLTLEADMTMDMDMAMAITAGGQDIEMTMEMAMSGTVENAVATE